MEKNGKHGYLNDARRKILLIMKLTVVFLLVTFLSVSASVSGQQTTIKMENVHLKEVFKEIKKQMGYTFIFNELVVNKVGKISLNVTSEDVKEIMNKCLAGTSLGYYIQNEVIVILSKADTAAKEEEQEKVKIKGTVVDEQGKVLPGVTILIKGTRLGTATDVKGGFSLEIPKMDTVVLVFSFVGMQQEEVKLTKFPKEMKPLKVVMKEDKKALDEVVVTGMFNRKKEGFTGSAVSVKGEELKKFSTTSIVKALSAIDPSFRIMDDIMNGSNPNRLPDLRMRGQATLPGGSNAGASSDMVTLQGEYDTYPNKPLLILDGFEISLQTMVDMDPDRVESITLLKDAAATAIYGSRAANGVIVIESKTPKEGSLWVTYSGNARIETPDLSDYNLMNAAEKLAVELEAGVYSNVSNSLEELELYQAKLREVKRGVDTYWLDKPLRTAVQHRHAITLEGGDRALRYRLYFGANFTPGVMKGSKRDVQTGSLDLQYRFKKVLLKNSITVDNAIGDESPWGDFSEYTKLNPYLRPYGPNGEVLKRLDAFDHAFRGSETYANPMYNATLKTKNRTTSFTVREQFSVEYSPTEDIRLNGSFSLSKTTGKWDRFRPAQHTAFDKETDPTKRGDFSRTQDESFNYSLDLTVSYNKLFRGVHYVTGNLGMSVQETQSSSYGAHVTGFPNENMDDILFGKKYDEKMTGTENTSRLIGWVGSFGYSYDYKYSIDFNIRVDGSSQFGKDNRFAPFWSTGLRWNVKKENFMNSVDFVSDLVLRGTYGVTGTQGFAPYQSRELYSYSELLKPYVSSNGTGVELVAMPNEKLKWQQTEMWNVGMELGLLDGRITARAEYYYKLTKNSLTQITLAPSLGFSSYPENMGTLENEGVELNLSFIPYQDVTKAAHWIINVNGSHNVDKLKKISEAMRKMNEQNSDNVADIEASKKNGYKPLPMYQEGESINRIWVVRSLGIDPATGEEIFLKRNGQVTGEWDATDLVPCGNTEPKWQGNINSSFAYKGFDVNVSFAYKFGGQAYNSTLVSKVENADLMFNADKRVLHMRWREVGQGAQYKRLSKGENGTSTKASSRFVMDENTFQMSSLSLGYRMDKTNAKYIEKWGLSSVKVTFNMEDLFYLSSIKQERGLSYPFARQFSLALTVAF